MISGRSAGSRCRQRPARRCTTWMPSSCRAMYGIVATMPVSATASASQRLPKRPLHEIGGRDVAVPVAHVPQAREDQEQDRIDDDRVRHGEEGERAGAERERRHRDEGVGGVEVAADQEPGDQRAEAAPAEAPLVQLVEVAAAPARGGEAEPGDEREQHREHHQRGDVTKCRSTPWRSRRLVAVGREVDDRREHRAHQDGEQLVPIEERDADPGRLDAVEERRPERHGELEHEEQVPPAPTASPLVPRVVHGAPRARRRQIACRRAPHP